MSSSQSDSSQQQVQETQDNRISAAEGASTLVASRSSVGGNVNVTSTDYGSVTKAIDLTRDLMRGAASMSAANNATISDTVQSAMHSVQEAYAGSTDKVADAWAESKAGENKVMVMVGLAVVALVAIKIVGK